MDSAFDFRLLPEHLSKKCDPGSFAFTTTDELPELEDVVGQPRAFQALQLGCELKSGGFNIFVLGLPGSGKLTLTRQYLERKAKNSPCTSHHRAHGIGMQESLKGNVRLISSGRHPLIILLYH